MKLVNGRYVLDEATVYNSAHLLGFLSVFNSDAIKDVKVITRGIPAERCAAVRTWNLVE